MITRSEIEQAVITWLVTATGLTVILEDESGPRPPLPYITIDVETLDRVGEDPLIDTDDQGVSTYTGNRETDVSVQGFGSGSFDSLGQAIAALEHADTLETLKAAGLVVRDVEQIVSGSIKRDTKWEKHFSVDVAFGTDDTRTVNTGFIEIVTGTQTTKDATDTTVDSDSFQIGG